MAGTFSHYHTQLPRIVAATGTTDANGDAVFVFDTPFDVPPVVTVGVGRIINNSAAYFHKLSAVSETGVTVHLDQSIGIGIGGIQVLALQTPVENFTINIIAMEPTQ